MTETLAEIVIDRRFRGPTHSGNGGIVAGRLAEWLGDDATVTLRRPIPLDTPLRVVRRADGLALMQGDTMLAEATPGTPELDAPGPVPVELAAKAAGAPLIADPLHAAPHCWVCGPLAPPEAMHVRTGATALAEGPACAGVWTPGLAQSDAEGRVEAVHLWGALDCPSGVAAMAAEPGPIHEVTLLLGRISARIERRPFSGAPLVVTTRSAGRDGRKLHAESAVHDATGLRLALARATWIEVPAEKLLGAAD